jgi:hypothetical protein
MYADLVKKTFRMKEVDCDPTQAITVQADSSNLPSTVNLVTLGDEQPIGQDSSNLPSTSSQCVSLVTLGDEQPIGQDSSSAQSSGGKEGGDHPKEKRRKTFITINLKSISSQFTGYKYRNLCFWALYYDLQNFPTAKKLAIKLYANKELPGVKYLSHPILAVGREKPIFFFSEPIEDACFMIFVGETIVAKMKHEKQVCNLNYDRYIYCLQKGQRYTYRISY